MISLGPLYADVIQYYHRNTLPIIEKGWTQETEFPYRKSKICIVLRLPYTHPGFVLGIWRKADRTIIEEEAEELLAAAIGLRSMDLEPEDVREW
jgi:hypothetical protein